MDDLIAAVGLVMVIEGALYALFPNGVKRMMAVAFEQPPGTLRTVGTAVAILCAVVVWLVRG